MIKASGELYLAAENRIHGNFTVLKVSRTFRVTGTTLLGFLAAVYDESGNVSGTFRRTFTTVLGFLVTVHGKLGTD